jgi:hypothetical protein
VRLPLNKDSTILAVLGLLWARLGPDAFVINDHWESDLCAVGIASPRNPGILVYIATFGELPERFGYELELPPSHGDVLPYQIAGQGRGVTFDELADVVASHLSRRH